MVESGERVHERLLLAARFYRGNASKIRGQLVSRKCFDVHFDQTDERTIEVRFGFAASIDNHADGGDAPAVRAHNIDRFLDATTARHDILDDNELFAIIDLKAASQDKFAVLFFNKNVALAQRPSDFLTDDDSTEGRGDHRVASKYAQLLRQLVADLFRNSWMLKQERALKILPAVQAGAQNKMAIQQRAGFPKECEQIFAHGLGSARASRAGEGAPA